MDKKGNEETRKYHVYLGPVSFLLNCFFQTLFFSKIWDGFLEEDNAVKIKANNILKNNPLALGEEELTPPPPVFWNFHSELHPGPPPSLFPSLSIDIWIFLIPPTL